MMISQELLSGIPLFSKLSPRTQRYIAEKSLRLEYPAGHILYRQGDSPSPLYGLCSGRVKLYRQSKEKCQILALPMQGDCIGAESMPTGATNPYSAMTLTPVVTICLFPHVLQILLDELPDFQESFLQLITGRLKQFITLVHDLAFRNVTSRLAMVLVLRADTEGQPHPEGVMIDRLLSQQEFAEMVGTAREVVYRTFKKFEDDGLIQITRKNILIRNLPALRIIAIQESR